MKMSKRILTIVTDHGIKHQDGISDNLYNELKTLISDGVSHLEYIKYHNTDGAYVCIKLDNVFSIKVS